MTTINFADDVHPKNLVDNSESDEVESRLRKTITRTDDGIYNIRSRSRARSIDGPIKRVLTVRSTDEDPGLNRDSDLKKAQNYSGKLLFWLSYQSIGVIYGDIGTSPLYVFSSTFSAPPDRQDLLGVLSIVIWSLILMVTLKYVIIILNADNDGEGGTFSTYALLSRYMNITHRDPREASLIRMSRYMSGDLGSAGRSLRHTFEGSKILRGMLKLMGVLAVSMVISDGVLTPAQSVLGAVQGIEVVAPNISSSVIVGVTDAILVLLFVIQPLGITKISYAFAPIIAIWLLFNLAFGIYNVVKYDAGVFSAFNPGYAFSYLILYKERGWRDLGGVLLAFTGVEALFADLGAFSARAIRISWLGFVFPCLLFAYIGQAAYISRHPEAYSNPFFNAAPPGTLYPSLVMAILAAIVASQAIITATFQLLAQVMKLSYFPQLKVVHTSKVFHGQIYVPLANWLLMIGTILIASIYNNTTSLGNAYGVCVMFVTFFDTCMVSLVAIFVWKFSPFLVFLPWLTIAAMDGAFLSSALTKVPQGAWFTITLATVIASIFLIWRYGKEQQWTAEAEDRVATTHFIKVGPEQELSLTDRYDGTPMSTIRGFGMFFDKAGEKTPIVFSQFVTKLTAATEIMVFFHLRPLETPSVPYEERYTVSRLAVPNCYRLVVRYGYNDAVVSHNLASVVHEQLRNYLIERFRKRRASVASYTRPVVIEGEKDQPLSEEPEAIDGSAESIDEPVALTHTETDENLTQELTRLDRAFDHKVLYVIGKESMAIRKKTNIWRRSLLACFLWMRENTRTKMANLNVPKDKVVEVGFLKDI